MLNYALKRIAQAIPILFLVSLISFGIMYLVPGDPAAFLAGPNANGEDIARVRESLGLNKSLPEQLLIFYSNLLRGDLGHSYIIGKPVAELVLSRLPISVSLTLYALTLTLLIGLVMGVVAALYHNRWPDMTLMTVALLGVSIPNFWLGLAMIVVFAVKLGWLPTSGYVAFSEDPLGWLRYATLPALALAFMQIGLLARMTRSTMLEVLSQDYVRTARAKGLGEPRVILRHALANALLPIVTLVGLIISTLLSGSVVVETIFSTPGIGNLLGNAIFQRDYPMIQGGLIFVASLLLVLNIIVDLLYAVLDPRVRVS